MAQPERGRQDAVRLVLAVVAVLVVAAVALAVVLLDGDDGVTTLAAQAEATPGATASDEPDEADEAVEPTTSGEAGELGEPGEPCPAPPEDAPAPTTTPYGAPPSADLGDADVVRATLRTSCGDIDLDLDAAGAPTTVANFVGLAEDGYYDGVGFHRVIDDFMIQGGDPTGTGSGCLNQACTAQLPGYTFLDELGPARRVVDDTGGYPRGTLAMANRGPDTNGSQFFIVQAAPGYPLPPQYAVFGVVASGMEVVDRIALGPVDGQLAIDPVVVLGVDVQR